MKRQSIGWREKLVTLPPDVRERATEVLRRLIMQKIAMLRSSKPHFNLVQSRRGA